MVHLWHNWQPSKVFDSFYEGEGWAVSILGLECKCGERKLEEKREASVGATQKAYNWLNFKEYLDETDPAAIQSDSLSPETDPNVVPDKDDD